VPYTLEDMAADTIGLLDALHIPAAHVVGASMGGMIGQLLAADYPARVLSLASIMSSSGNPALPPPAPAAVAALISRPLDTGITAAAEFLLATLRILASPGYEFDEALARGRVLEEMQRGYNPAGFSRQLAAVTVNGDRRPKLRCILAPTLVVHGEQDPLFPAAAARDVAESIAGAELKLIAGMGHDLPPPLYDAIVAAIVRNAQRASMHSSLR